MLCGKNFVWTSEHSLRIKPVIFVDGHQHLQHCKLALASTGRDMRPPIIAAGRAELAGKAWKTTFYPTEGEFSYTWGFENKFYLFNVIMTPNPSDETVKACRTAAEAVLNTFVLVEEK